MPQLKIAWILDERLPADKTRVLLKTIAALKPLGEIQSVDGTLSQESVLELLEKNKFSLVMLPWYRYLAWKKVEAYFGLTRTNGPTVCGYFTDPFKNNDLEGLPDYQRLILIDLNRSTTPEVIRLLGSLLHDQNRSGLRPLIKPTTPVFFATWDSPARTSMLAEGLFQHSDFSMSLKDRKFAVQTCLQALSHYFFATSLGTSGQPSFQAAVENDFCVLRASIGLAQPPTSQMLQALWPKNNSPTSAVSTLYRYSDFVRAHWTIRPNQLEITLGFQASRAQEKAPDELHTIWLEPLSPDLIKETLFVLKPEPPLLQPLPEVQLMTSVVSGDPALQAKIQTLQKQLHEKDMIIRDMRSGGVGVAFKKE